MAVDPPETSGPWRTAWTWQHRMASDDGTREKVLRETHGCGGWRVIIILRAVTVYIKHLSDMR